MVAALSIFCLCRRNTFPMFSFWASYIKTSFSHRGIDSAPFLSIQKTSVLAFFTQQLPSKALTSHLSAEIGRIHGFTFSCGKVHHFHKQLLLFASIEAVLYNNKIKLTNGLKTSGKVAFWNSISITWSFLFKSSAKSTIRVFPCHWRPA